MPGPGSKRMKPKGLVAAASTTSQTSMPIRSQSTASSLTSAMLTERKMFSSSLASSAASGAETSTIVVADPPVQLRGALARRPASARRRPWRVAQREVGAARVDALGRVGDVEVAAGGQAGLLEQRHAAARASCPDRSSTRARRAGPRAARARARWRRRPAGPGRARGCAVSGVGHADDDRVHLRQRRRSRGRSSAAGSTCGAARVAGTSSMWLSPALDRRRRARRRRPRRPTSLPCLGERHRQRQPDVSEARRSRRSSRRRSVERPSTLADRASRPPRPPP